MPMKTEKYPENWKAISQYIRERAGNKCEVCGVDNHALIFRFIDDPERFIHWEDEQGFYDYAEEIQDKPVRIVLTVAHLNHDTTDNRDENLKALCQLHHLRHDAKYHAQNARVTRLNHKREAILERGQLELFED